MVTGRWMIAARISSLPMAATLMIVAPAVAQESASWPIDTSYIFVEGARVQYIDFGGVGVPVILTAGSRPADTWLSFAPRVTNHHRVLAITHRGVPPSEGDQEGI